MSTLPTRSTRSDTTIEALAGEANAAWPHQEIDGQVQPIERRSWRVVAPSAAVNTSAREMAEWLRLQLGEPGVHRGVRLLADATMREMHRPHVALGGSPLSGAPFAGYGLGWSVSLYKGHWTSSTGALPTG